MSLSIPSLPKLSQWPRRKRVRVFGTIGIAVLIAIVFLPPARFPAGEIIRIKSGLSVGEAAERLQGQNIIRSQTVFKLSMLLFGGHGNLVAGDYLLSRPMTVVELAYRLANGDFGMKALRATIPEGSTNSDIAKILGKILPSFSPTKFLELAKDKEGYLFPDTYFFLPSATEDSIIETMENNFKRQIIILNPQISRSGKNLAEILTMASILEKELKPGDDRRVASGILWKRLSEGVRLQVDVAKETYKNYGLPDGPIANPGLDAIKAALEPTSSPYWYYLSGKDGRTHFATTLNEHIANQKKYL